MNCFHAIIIFLIACGFSEEANSQHAIRELHKSVFQVSTCLPLTVISVRQRRRPSQLLLIIISIGSLGARILSNILEKKTCSGRNLSVDWKIRNQRAHHWKITNFILSVVDDTTSAKFGVFRGRFLMSACFTQTSFRYVEEGIGRSIASSVYHCGGVCG